MWTWEWWWSEEGEASRRKMQGGKKEESVEIEFGFWIWEENWEREDREEVTENLHTVGRRGGAAGEEPIEERREVGRMVSMESWKDEEERKPMMVARRVAEEEVSSSSSTV